MQADEGIPDPETLRVATWNIWWRHGPWQERQPGILNALRQLDAGVIALQEVSTRDPDQLRWLGEALGMHAAAAPDGAEDRHGIANGVLSRWPIVSSSWEYLDVGDMPPHRTVLSVAIDSPYGIVDAYCTHLSHGFHQSGLRQRQLRQIAEIIDSERSPEPDAFPPVLLGDLNAVPDSDEIRMLTGRSAPAAAGLVFSDAWEQSGPGPGATYSNANPHVVDSAWPDRRLDYILIGWPRPRPRGNPLSAALFGSEPIRGTVPSDHYGVVADLIHETPRVDVVDRVEKQTEGTDG